MSPDWKRDNERVLSYFSGLLDKHGAEVAGVDWGSRESQRLRFSILTALAPLEGMSILDVGCGMGDLAGFLIEEGITVQYTGVDLNERMIEIATGRNPELEFVAGDILADHRLFSHSFDYVIGSGLFYLRQTEPLIFMEAMATRMFALAGKGVALNTLSTHAPEKTAGEFYTEPADAIAIGSKITKRFALRHDYLPHDFTVYLYREPS